MKSHRFEFLSDGIFAIVMTLLVIELKVPTLQVASNSALWEAIKHDLPLFGGYLVSFALLFIYWRAHHYIVTNYAKVHDRLMMEINAAFLFFVTLVPFSAHLLGTYPQLQLSHLIYGGNIIAIGLLLTYLRDYVYHNHHIKGEMTYENFLHGTVRLGFPIFFAILAICFSYVSVYISLALYFLSIVFNLMYYSSDAVLWAIEKLRGKKFGVKLF